MKKKLNTFRNSEISFVNKDLEKSWKSSITSQTMTYAYNYVKGMW